MLEYMIVVLDGVVVVMDVLECVIVVLDGVVFVLDVLECVIVVMDVLEYVIVVMGVVDEVVVGVTIGLIVVLWEVLEAFEMELVEVVSGTQPGRTVEEPL